MFRIGRDFRGLFVYEDDRPITNAVGEIIIVPIFMLIAPLVLILLFFWSLGVPGVISAIVMSIVAFVAFWFSKRNTGLKQKVICAWYSTIICVLYVVSIVYSIYARNEWGFFTWVAMGLCGLTLIFVTMSINNFDLVSGIVWISIRKLQVQVGHLHGRNLVATSVGQDGSFWFPSWAMLPQPEAA